MNEFYLNLWDLGAIEFLEILEFLHVRWKLLVRTLALAVAARLRLLLLILLHPLSTAIAPRFLLATFLGVFALHAQKHNLV